MKTSDTERYRRFESYSLRHYFGDIPKLGRRGSPAKGVDRDTGARVQISLSPPNKKDTFTVSFFVAVLMQRFELEQREPGGEKLTSASCGRYSELISAQR